MNAASIELCKKLSDVSGWETDWVYRKYSLSEEPMLLQIPKGELDILIPSGELEYTVVAYDLGYVLRKLPKKLVSNDEPVFLTLEICDHDGYEWAADYVNINANYLIAEYDPDITHANTPEDAVCKLAIELFKQELMSK